MVLISWKNRELAWPIKEGFSIKYYVFYKVYGLSKRFFMTKEYLVF